jgi:rubrerythrin
MNSPETYPGAGGFSPMKWKLYYYMPEWEEPEDIIFLAMAIEGQALDLYLRAAGQTTSTEGQKILTKIAQEEKSHLASLGELMDRLVSSSTP